MEVEGLRFWAIGARDKPIIGSDSPVTVTEFVELMSSV
jgi:hypothetical protein